MIPDAHASINTVNTVNRNADDDETKYATALRVFAELVRNRWLEHCGSTKVFLPSDQ